MTLDEILSDLYLRLHTADEARDLIDGIIWRQINAHVAAEREACAKGCETSVAGFGSETEWADGYIQAAKDIAEGIRARGKK